MEHISYGRHSIDKSDIDGVVRALKSDRITQGPAVPEFEAALCRYTGAEYAVAVSSGTAALHISCLAAGIGKGDRVITSPMTFLATANSVLYCGGKPVFADVHEDTANIDPEEIKKKITKKVKAIIPVHFAGHPADLEEIRSIADKHDLTVIEDACHALGAEYKGSRIGACKHSDMTVFSFHPVKHITTGEGGAVTTNRKDLYEKLLMLRNHGITREKEKLGRWDGPWYYEQQMLGFNYRISDFQCALGISQLQRLDTFLKRRRRIVDYYNKQFSSIDGLILPVERPYVRSSWHIYCVKFRRYSRRKKIFEGLHRAGIGAQIHYIPVHLQPYYRGNFGYKRGDYPKAEEHYRKTTTIPLYPKMEGTEKCHVANILRTLLK